jgi:hypothetical protein
MPVNYQLKIEELQAKAMKPNLTRVQEEAINQKITKYYALLQKQRSKRPRKGLEQKALELQKKLDEVNQKIMAQQAKVNALPAEKQYLKSNFVGPLMPSQMRGSLEFNQNKEVKAMVRQAKLEARLADKEQKKADRLAYKQALAQARATAKQLKADAKAQREQMKALRGGVKRTTRIVGRVGKANTRLNAL